jgi:subtilisin family serine protease
LAFAAGHGTFIATLVSRVAPKCVVGVGTVLKNSGVGDEWTIASRIHYLKKSLSKTAEDLTRASNSVLNLSFGAPLQDLDEPGLLAHVVKSIQSIGVVVVASAGNDSLSRPSFPAALPDVVSAGSLAPTGPAVFSNYGPWVDACAPGVDIVSVFFGDKAVATDGFHGWAMWSGTSFSSAIVAGAIARLVYDRGISAKEARSILIDAPGLMQLPGLGTVVNVT